MKTPWRRPRERSVKHVSWLAYRMLPDGEEQMVTTSFPSSRHNAVAEARHEREKGYPTRLERVVHFTRRYS